ncbi:hypothetical protein COLINT_03333 [Collinsella intestinalis DSM 13280]|uniref:Uncharacterized protein n=1 Tax=Collinsella intestinalis DSM 13280 TaxID=521003 RepID=C4FB81_9ACTN|nr:hypothetical protein COLINT_03333 [Collinsella intestinalis DSM 13280]
MAARLVGSLTDAPCSQNGTNRIFFHSTRFGRTYSRTAIPQFRDSP